MLIFMKFCASGLLLMLIFDFLIGYLKQPESALGLLSVLLPFFLGVIFVIGGLFGMVWSL